MASQDRDQKAQYLRAIFDAFPVPAFVVDSDVRIEDFNMAAELLLGAESASALQELGGEALHCIHAEEAGCGNAQPCKDCVIRKSVTEATAGKATCRARHRAHCRTPKGIVELDLLVTASLLPYTEKPKALLILENLNELSRLRRFKPRSRRREPDDPSEPV